MNVNLEEVLGASLGTLTLGKAVQSLLLLVVCLLVIRLVMGVIGKIMEKSSWDARVKLYAAKGIRALLYILTILVVAGNLGIDVTSLIALVSVFGLAVSLAVQDVLANVAGGMVILFSKPFTPGDYVETGDGEGTVAEISLTHTKLDTVGGQRIMLPNSKLVAGKVVNYSVLGTRRVNHEITAAYTEDAEKVRRACLKAVARTEGVLAEPAPEVIVAGYGDSAVKYNVRFWTTADNFWPANNASLEEIRRCFAEDGVTMTYNHLNVHVLDKTNEK